MFMSGISKITRRDFILPVSVIYLFFSCFYVFLCQRNTGVVSFMSVSKTIVSKTQLTSGKPVSVKFLSRPRVIKTNIFKVLIVAPFLYCLFFFILNKSINCFFVPGYFVRPKLYGCLLQTWRI